MKIFNFNYKDIEDDDIKLEINFDLLSIRAFATTYNFNGEVVSRNKTIFWWRFKSKNKLFKVLKNNIGNMSESTRVEYLKFIDKLEKE